MKVEGSWPCVRIGSDVLEQCYTKYTDKTILSTMAGEPFFIAIDWFTKSLKFRQAEGKMGHYENHLTYYQKHSEKIKNILKGELYNGYELDFLNVSIFKNILIHTCNFPRERHSSQNIYHCQCRCGLVWFTFWLEFLYNCNYCGVV